MILDNLKFFCFICIVLVTLQTSHAIPDCPKYDEDKTCKKNGVEFYFRAIIGDKTIDHELEEENLNTFITADFIEGKPLKFIVHGHGETMDDFLVAPLQKEYFKLGYNVVVINYNRLSQENEKNHCYRTGVENSPNIAICAAKIINNIIERNKKSIKIDNFHLIGLSLGGQIVGQIPHHIDRMYWGRIPRITGIDPANDGFFEAYGTDEYILTVNDALLVDVIHSNAGIVGKLPPIGHIDWYPNGGTFQPECSEGNYICDHMSSLIYYLESIGDSNFKIKVQWCPYLEAKDFKPDLCKDFDEIPFGENVTKEDIDKGRMKKGVYFFKTKPTFPYMREGAHEYSVYKEHLKKWD